MQLAQVMYKGRKRVGAMTDEGWKLLPRPGKGGKKLDKILHSESPATTVQELLPAAKLVDIKELQWLAPISKQEVWAAGVTYQRSESARKEESQGAAQFYAAVYQADRPELFFKSTPHRVVGHQQPIRIRGDSNWNVPEPELTLVLNPSLDIVGYTIGNDVSSRSIEGENPLYLPQAKVYSGSCALGPVIHLADDSLQPMEWIVELKIEREKSVVYQGSTSVNKMVRPLADLVQWLGRDNSFPDGCFLMTGTGVVPGNDFTLQARDVVSMSIGPLGTLTNTVSV